MRKSYIAGAFVVAAAMIGAAITKYGWSLGLNSSHEQRVIAGMVIDQRTNSGVGQASINIVGRPE
jgi:hypothetical protein